MFINRKLGELNLKIVYYGPAYSGKTTNLEIVHQRTPANMRGDMISLKTHGDRTLFFDYLQMELAPVYGLKPKFNLYTVPGQVEYTATRKLVLQGADGVIFIVDSRSTRIAENVQSLVDLYKHLTANGIDPHKVALTIQFNKRDLPDALPIEALRQALGLDKFKLPHYEAVAANGIGVFDTLKSSINSVMHRLQAVRLQSS
jgi:hypothetical protein